MGELQPERLLSPPDPSSPAVIAEERVLSVDDVEQQTRCLARALDGSGVGGGEGGGVRARGRVGGGVGGLGRARAGGRGGAWAGALGAGFWPGWGRSPVGLALGTAAAST